MEKNQRVVIGVDPHKLSITIEVVDRQGGLLGQGRYATDKAGFAASVRYVKAIESSREDPVVGGRGRQRGRPGDGPAAAGGG